MKKTALSFVILLIIVNLTASPLINNLRFSAINQDNQIVTRGELVSFYDLSFYYQDSGQWQYVDFSHIDNTLASYQAILPAPDQTPRHIGIRAYNDVVSELDAGVAIQPIPWTGQEQPSSTDLNWLLNDASEDASVDESFLDIISTHFTYDEEKLYFAIENNGGGFPVSEAIWGPFYSYISLIIPNDIALTPFGLLYTVNQAGIIQPGLYKITGMEMTDIQLIGDIETVIDQDNNLLILSCDWSDLYADEDFNSWFDPDQAMFSTVSGTGMITLAGGMQETDYTYPAVVFLDELTLEENENILPEISSISPDPITGLLSFSYFDSNGNFPLTSQAVIDGTDSLSFYPQSHDFSQEVVFISEQASQLIMGEWEEILVRVSDNDIDFVTSTIEQVSNESNQAVSPNFSVRNYPNPFNPQTTISFNINERTYLTSEIFNLKGQKITNLESGYYARGKHNLVWNGKDDNKKDMPSGVYYLRLKTDKEEAIHKMLLMK